MFIFLLKLLKTIIQYFTTESSVVEILFPNTEKVLENPITVSGLYVLTFNYRVA